MGSHDKVSIDFFKALTIVCKMTISFEMGAGFTFFTRFNFFDPCDPHGTFDPTSICVNNGLSTCPYDQVWLKSNVGKYEKKPHWWKKKPEEYKNLWLRRQGN